MLLGFAGLALPDIGVARGHLAPKIKNSVAICAPGNLVGGPSRSGRWRVGDRQGGAKQYCAGRNKGG